jgi:hypothetical protein
MGQITVGAVSEEKNIGDIYSSLRSASSLAGERSETPYVVSYSGVLPPLAAGVKVCEVCLARVYRGFSILDLCTTRVRPVYGMVTSLQSCKVTTGDAVKAVILKN